MRPVICLSLFRILASLIVFMFKCKAMNRLDKFLYIPLETATHLRRVETIVQNYKSHETLIQLPI